jgi:hypothetical protein
MAITQTVRIRKPRASRRALELNRQVQALLDNGYGEYTTVVDFQRGKSITHPTPFRHKKTNGKSTHVAPSRKKVK